MAEQVLAFTVTQCPFPQCHKSHRYRIHVRTVLVFGGGDTTAPSSPQTKDVNVYVPCPTAKEKYKVTVSIPVTPGSKIVLATGELDGQG